MMKAIFYILQDQQELDEYLKEQKRSRGLLIKNNQAIRSEIKEMYQISQDLLAF